MDREDIPYGPSPNARTDQDTYRGATGPSDIHVLVTGGAGFIGGHLAEAVLEDGHDATVRRRL